MKYVIALCLAILAAYGAALPQTCAPPQIVANAKVDNLFSPEQEMVLGELTLQRLSSEFRPMRDAQLLAFVETIGTKLIKHLPPTGLKYQFHIIDYPEANAFNIPGGHVFLSRKLIAFVNSEDELASVIAHELGHATVHHGAQDMSLAMRKVLNVTALGDRKDVADKYNLLIENARTKRVSGRRRGHEDGQQLEADAIGFFAMVAAGYDPNASFTFFDRLTESEGKTGSWFSDIFGGSKPEQKRLREIAQATEKLPQSCRDGRSAKATEDFLRWQADVVSFREAGRAENVPGLLWKREITPKLRSDVRQIKFSNDGKRLLVVDDFSVTVIDREALKVLNQIPAEDVSSAYFAADNTQVVFTTENMRFERWDVASGKALEVRELVLRRNCWEHALSPDGNYLACVDLATTINVIETKTGKRVWEKKEFYPLSYFEYITWLGSESRDDENPASFFRISFSPDSKRVLFSRSNKYRFRLRVDGMTMDESENTALAVDLSTMKPIDLGGDMKKVAARPYVFLDPTRIIGNTAPKLEAGGIFSFPEGKRLQKVNFGAEYIGSTAEPNYVVLKPLVNASVGLFDVSRSAVVTGMNKNDLAVWKDLIAFESASGKITFRQFKYDDAKKVLDGNDVGSVEIPVGTMSDVRAAEISEDFGWVVLSSKTRGGIWNMKTGERATFTRGFRAGIVDNQGASVANFPKFQDAKHSLALLDPKTGEGQVIRELPDFGARQYGRFLLIRTSSKEKDDKDLTPQQRAMTEEEQAEVKLRSDVKFEVKDWVQDKVIWTKDFKGSVPRYSFDGYSGRLIIYWRLTSDEGKARLKEDAALKAKAEALGSKEGDYMIEVIDAFEAKTVGTMMLETGKGSFSVFSGQSEREWLVLRDSEDRVLVYSMNDGTLRHRFFGSHAAINPRRNMLVVENFPGDVALYNLDSGDKLTDFRLNGSLAFSRFSLDGNRLFLFSDSQVGYGIDLTRIPIQVKKPIAF